MRRLTDPRYSWYRSINPTLQTRSPVLQGLIPSVESVQDSLLMTTVLEEAIQHLKGQHTKSWLDLGG